MDWNGFWEAMQQRVPSPQFETIFRSRRPDRAEFPLEDALYTVTEYDHLSALELIVDYFHINLETTTCQPYISILHLACAMGSLGATCFCLDRKAPLELQDSQGFTPLVRAVFSGNEGFLCAQVLLEAGANPNVCDARGWSILHCAVFHGACAPQTLELLLQHGAHPNARDAYRRTPLHLAMVSSVRGVKALVPTLLRNGADANMETVTGYTPLALSRTEDVALLLLEAGARPEIPTQRGETILHFACQRWKKSTPEVFDAIVSIMYTITNVHMTDREGHTPLHWVCQQSTANSLRYVDPLIMRGANPDARDRLGRSPVQHAVLAPSVSFASAVLLSAEGRINDGGDRPPPEADVDQSIPHMERALALGAEIAFQDFDGHSALHYAVLTGQVQLVRWLLEHGAPVAQRDHRGRTPLHLFGFHVGPIDVTSWEASSTADFLFDNGHDESRLQQTRDPQYDEPRFPFCVVRGEAVGQELEETAETLRILLEAGAPVHVQDDAGNYPFFLASQARNIGPIFALVRQAAAQGLFQRS
jgi:ankyrin repeat protein